MACFSYILYEMGLLYLMYGMTVRRNQLTGIIWPWPHFHGSVVKVNNFEFWFFFSFSKCERSTIFGVWKYFMMYMPVLQVLFDPDIIFTVHCSVLSFCVLVCFISIRSTIIFVVLKGCKLYMSAWHGSSELDLIFMVHWSMFGFLG